MKPLNIVIDDENRYFAAGLRLSIVKYAQQHNNVAHFLPPGSDERPDIVLASRPGAPGVGPPIPERMSSPLRKSRPLLPGARAGCCTAPTINSACLRCCLRRWLIRSRYVDFPLSC